MRAELEYKIKAAIKLLQAFDSDEPVEIAYSGGKDSDVILQLAKEAGINYRAIYKNTTIDPPGTIKHVKEMGVEIQQPKMSFLKLIEKKGMPSRFTRFCCAELKEYKILDKCVIGVRREESRKRAERYIEPTICRVYSKNCHIEQIMPILEWTLEDIAEFITDRKIKLAPMYYRPDGTIDFTRRLGCLGCPLASEKKRVQEFLNYPNMVKAYCKAHAIFRETHPDSRANKMYDDVYENFTFELWKNHLKKVPTNKNALIKTDYKDVLEKFFNIQLP